MAATRPTPSWPGTNGGVGFTGQSPWAAWMSVWHRPEASTFTSTCPGPGSGVGRSSIARGLVEGVDDGGLHGGLPTGFSILVHPSDTQSAAVWVGAKVLNLAAGGGRAGKRGVASGPLVLT